MSTDHPSFESHPLPTPSPMMGSMREEEQRPWLDRGDGEQTDSAGRRLHPQPSRCGTDWPRAWPAVVGLH